MLLTSSQNRLTSFAETMNKIVDLKPDVLLLDLHLPEKRHFTPALVKSQLGTVRTLAVSFSNDADSKALAESDGALSLLDKMTLYQEMIPAIRRCHPEIAKFLRKPFKRGARA
jgi:hypothetical protein